MERPLWRILLAIGILVVALHRLGMAGLALMGESTPVLLAAHAAEAAAALVAALGLWLGRRWTAPAILALGVAFGATALLDGFYLGVVPPAAAVAQLLVAVFAGGALALAVRRELTSPAILGDADDPPPSERPEGHGRRDRSPRHGQA